MKKINFAHALWRRIAAASLAATIAHGLSGDDRLLGAWETPSGNVITLLPAVDGALTGTYVAVNDASQRVGFALGQTVVDEVRVQGDQVNFRVVMRIDDPAITPVATPAQVPFTGRLTGDTIQGTIPDVEFTVVLDANGKATGTTFKILNETLALTYRRPACDCPATPPTRTMYTVEMESGAPLRIEADIEEPFGRGEPVMTARVRTIAGGPMARSEVHWQIRGRTGGGVSAEYTSLTDEEGRAHLGFALLPNGSFAPSEQIDAVPARTLPPGDYEVRASVPALDLGETAPAAVVLQRRTGTQLLPTDSAWNPLPLSLVLPDSDELRLRFDITHWAADATEPDHVTLHLSSYAPGATQPHAVTNMRIPRAAPGQYRVERDVVIAAGNAIGGASGASSFRMALPKPGGLLSYSPEGTVRIEAYVPEFTTRVQLHVHASGLDNVLWVLQRHLTTLRETLAAIERDQRSNDRAALTLLAQKRGLVDRALTIVESRETRRAGQPELSKLHRACLGREYLDAIMERPRYRRNASQANYAASRSDRADFFTSALSADDPVTLPIALAVETTLFHVAHRRSQDLFRAGIEAGSRMLVADLHGAPGATAAFAWDMLRAPVLLTTSLVYGVVTGRALDGQVVDATDLLLLGLDISTFRLGSPKPTPTLKRLHRRLAEWRTVGTTAERFGLDLEKRRNVRLVHLIRRFGEAEPLLAQLFRREMELPADLSQRLQGVLERISNSSTLMRVRERLIEFDTAAPTNPRNRLARQIGFVLHRLKELEERAFWEHKLSARTAVATAQGGFREAVSAGESALRLGDLEARFEWRIPDGSDKRIDYMLINHANRTVCIVDLAPQLRSGHRKKTSDYARRLRSLPEFAGWKTIRATELYWDEQAGRFVEALAEFH